MYEAPLLQELVYKGYKSFSSFSYWQQLTVSSLSLEEVHQLICRHVCLLFASINKEEEAKLSKDKHQTQTQLHTRRRLLWD